MGGIKKRHLFLFTDILSYLLAKEIRVLTCALAKLQSRTCTHRAFSMIQMVWWRKTKSQNPLTSKLFYFVMRIKCIQCVTDLNNWMRLQYLSWFNGGAKYSLITRKTFSRVRYYRMTTRVCRASDQLSMVMGRKNAEKKHRTLFSILSLILVSSFRRVKRKEKNSLLHLHHPGMYIRHCVRWHQEKKRRMNEQREIMGVGLMVVVVVVVEWRKR